MSTAEEKVCQRLRGKRIAFVGKLASMSKREAAQLARRHGAVVVNKPAASVDLAVVGEEELPFPEVDRLEEWFDEPARGAVQQGTLRVVSETQLWQQLGLVESEPEIRRLYTPAMLAELLGVPVAVIRRWHRRGLIVPVRKVRRLPYFDFQQVATARRLAELLAAGISPATIEKKLSALARYLPSAGRSLAQLSVIVQGKEILLRQGEGLLEPGGQLRFDFEAAEEGQTPAGAPAEAPESEAPPTVRPLGAARPFPSDGTSEAAETEAISTSPERMCRLAAELEEDGQLAAAVETYRAAMAAAGPSPEICFQVAELLYRRRDLAAARERYYMAVELDEDYVEARVNLGCVLAETGQRELAVAAFEGALAFHDQYADAHYHLARALDETGDGHRAEDHWRAFLALAPHSPWADEARARLG